MSKSPLAIVILAAGKGTRMKSDKPKVLHELAGKPMINWLIDTCTHLEPEKIIIVIGPDMAELSKAVAPHETVIQEERNGTGGAVKCALPALKDFNGNVLILMGDEPLVQLESLQALINADGLAVQGFDTLSPAGLGRMVLNEDGTLKEIIEDSDCTDAQKQISLCNAGNYCVPADKLAGWIEQIGNDNVQGEFYLTDLPAIAAKEGTKTQVVRGNWLGPWGINDRIQLAIHEKMLQIRMRENALLNGIAMSDPDSVYFYHDTKIESGVTIEPHVFFGSGVTIESGAIIKAFSHIEGAHIAANATVGPFARLRPETKIGEEARIGNFVEVKKSTIGKGSKVNHHGYVGDTEMGEDVNFSCGAITVNYDGFEKHKTTIGNNVMVGSNVSLVAPIKIGDGAFLAAGSTLTGDVDADALSMTRAETENKTGWAAKYRKLKNAAKKAAIVLAVLGFGTPALACEGFKNSMAALEQTLQVNQPKQEKPEQSDLPHLRSLKQDLDALEKAVAEYHAKKAAVTPTNKTPRLVNPL